MSIPQEPSSVDQNIELLCNSIEKQGVGLCLYHILIVHYQLIYCRDVYFYVKYPPSPGIDQTNMIIQQVELTTSI